MHMFRKWIFLGLMVMLGSVLVMLVVQGRRQEAGKSAVPAEKVQTARSTATRVFAPKDLDLDESRVELRPVATGKDGNPGRAALCRITVRNSGRLAYHDVMLKLTCFGAGGKVLDSRTQLVPGTVPPGQTITVPELAVDGLPRDSVRCGLAILYSDLGAAPAQ
jgi:hypothetical protein